MALYCVNRNAQPEGEHEVHNLETCLELPDPVNRVALGEHAICQSAVAKAKLTYPTADGCKICSPSCHNR